MVGAIVGWHLGTTNTNAAHVPTWPDDAANGACTPTQPIPCSHVGLQHHPQVRKRPLLVAAAVLLRRQQPQQRLLDAV